MYTHQKHQFTGELTIFNDRAVIVSARMGADGDVARLTPPQFRRLLAAEPDIANVVMRAYILRRDGLIFHGHTAVQIIAPRRQAESLQLQQFLPAIATRTFWPIPKSTPGGITAGGAGLDDR